jgi:hypothetical protein
MGWICRSLAEQAPIVCWTLPVELVILRADYPAQTYL